MSRLISLIAVLLISGPVMATTITLSPDPLVIPVSGSGNLTLTLATPAPTGGLTVSLASSNTLLATVSASITVPEGVWEAAFAVTSGATVGEALVSASAPGFTHGVTTVRVVEAVPLPAAAWLFLTALGGMFGLKRLRSG